MANKKRKYTNEELEKKINEYFEYCDNNPLYKYEQRKGNVTIPKDYQGDMTKLTNLVKIPIPRIYLLGELCDRLQVTPDYINRNITEATERLEKNEYVNSRERKKDRDLLKILTHARDKTSSQKLQLAAAGLANPIIVSKIEGLTDKTEVTNVNLDIENKSDHEIKAAIKAMQEARKQARQVRGTKPKKIIKMDKTG